MITEFKNVITVKDSLSSLEKREYLKLVIYMIIASIFEMLSIGLVFAIVMSVVNPSFFFESSLIFENIFFLANIDENRLILFFLIFFLIIYLLKSLILIYFYYTVNKYIASIKKRLSDKLLNYYTELPWIKFVQKNSSEFVRNIMIETGMFSGAILQTLLICAETIILIGLLTLLFFFQFKIMLLITVITLFFSLLIYFFTKKNLKTLSYERQTNDENRLKNLNEIFNGFKLLKIMHKFPNFLKNHKFFNQILAKIEVIQTTIQQLPKILFELAFMVSIAFFFLSLHYLKLDLISLLPTVSLFIASSFKIIPSINKIINCNLNIKASIPSLELINLEVKKSENLKVVQNNTNFNKLDFSKNIVFKDVNFSYSDSKKTSIEQINIEIKKGSQIGIIGESGAGKTTLVDMLTGLICPDSGQIFCDGKDIQKNLYSWQLKIGYIPQNVFLSDNTIEKNITLDDSKEILNIEKLNKVILEAELGMMIENLPNKTNTKIGQDGAKLSGGQRQRIGIARALYHDPEILILDESTSSLDEHTEKNIMETIKKLKGKKTVIIISHRKSTVKDCDKIFEISNGKIQ